MIPLPKLYTRAEAAKYLRVSKSTVSTLYTSGQLGYIRVGKNVMIPETALVNYMAGRAVNMPAPEHQEDRATWPPTPSLLADGQ